MSGDLIARVHQLRAHFDHLRTFTDVAHWDAAATALAADLDRAIREMRAHCDGLMAQADQHARAHAVLPFFKRLFSSQGEQRALRSQAADAHQAINHIGAAMNDLLECIDYTPNDEKERKALLKELRAEKKELQLQKREIAAEKREINQAARNASANAGRFLFMYDAKMAARERRAIRRDRVGQLAPLDDARHAIERQLRDLERRIMWVERFGKEE